MKYLWIILFFLSFNIFAQDPGTYLSQFDNKVYSLKSKGVKDFIVEIRSSKLTKEVNEQLILGSVKDLVFKVYWTSSPERLAVEVLGLPDGFVEVKENLKNRIMFVMEDLLPIETVRKFNGYKIGSGSKNREIIMVDTTGIAPIPQFVLAFDNQDLLIEIVGKKPVGTYIMKPSYEKEAFSDGKYALKSSVSNSSENGQTTTTKKELSYGKVGGFGVLEKIVISSQQKWESAEAKPLNLNETIELVNYRINTGDAIKYFLAEGTKALNPTNK